MMIDFPSKFSFLKEQLEKVKPYPEATASLLMQMAHYLITEVDDIVQAKNLLDKAERILDENPGSSFSIHAKLHRTMSEYAKRACDYTLYYKSSMTMLSCINLDAFPVQEQEIRGYYICLAALLSDFVYNFGELVSIVAGQARGAGMKGGRGGGYYNSSDDLREMREKERGGDACFLTLDLT